MAHCEWLADATLAIFGLSLQDQLAAVARAVDLWQTVVSSGSADQ